MTQLLHEGGATMLWLAALVLPTLALAIVHAAMPARWSIAMVLVMIVVVFGVGLYGTMQGRRVTDESIAMYANEVDVELLREEGYREAMRPIQFAGVIALVTAPLFVVGVVRRRKRLA